ncbi:MAG: ribonucleoside-diphosphate reductase subunit alpha [Aquificae bacterium]|nr:ribonucleoside-diphosphate reductase subunit alpha [Aquificota bacterium]
MFEVIKRDGRVEPFNPQKIEKVIKVCAEGLNVDLQKFEQKLALFLKPKMTTREIQHNLITAAISLIVTEENKEDWSRFANRLILVDFKKEIRVRREKKYGVPVTRYGFFVNFEDFYRFLTEYIEKGFYSRLLLEVPGGVMEELYYSIFDAENFSNPLWNKAKHMQTQKFIRSYLTEENNFPIEIPEEVWFLQSLLGFLPSVLNYGKDWEYFKKRVLKHFEYLSEFLIIPATPQMLNLRRARANLSSCFILDVNDNTESIVHTQSQIAQISRNAGGVGLYIGKLRPSGSWIKGNKGKANKITDWVKIYESTVNAFNQQGKRKGSLTVALPIWHKDVVDFLEVIDLDIGEIPKKSPDVFTQVVVPDFFFKFVNENRPFYLIDLYEVTHVLGRKDLDLVEVYGEEAERRYEEIVKLAEEGKLQNYRQIHPRELLRKVFYYWGRKGLPYVFFEDNVNAVSPFEEKIYCGNLCQENFSPFRNTDPEDLYCIPDEKLGYVHTCNITNVNLLRLHQLGYLSDVEKLKEFVFHLYEYMDNLIDVTDLPVKESKKHNALYRTVTAGFMGLADLFVAKSVEDGRYYGYRFSARRADPADTLRLIREVFGRFAFLAVLASTELAKERGRPAAYERTKYPKKVILGRYDLKREADRRLVADLVGEENLKRLEENLEKHGIRNTLLLNCPPNTSTSILAGVSAGIVPVFSLTQVEDQQTGLFVNFVPLYPYRWFYDAYTNFSDYSDYEDLTTVIAEIQKFVDGGISFEVTVNHNHFNTPEKLTRLFALVLREARKKGIKALYYWRHILKDKTVAVEECESCAN